MKSIPAILFFILFSLSGLCQQIIKGRVVNASTGATIAGCSIFIASTSKGTVSDNAGAFLLENVPPGKHDLIISSIGYETNVFSFTEAQLPLLLKIELSIKVKEMENVTIEPSVEEGWDKWGKSFMDNFIGNTENSLQCRIKNEKSIRFRYYKKSNRLTAYCDEPVLVENKALGYIISYQLENFELNFKEQSISYLGYPLYVPMGGKGRQQKWQRKRDEAYTGSILHFMRSLFSNQLVEEGFVVRRMVRTPNYEKQRVKAIYSSGMKKQLTNNVMRIEISNGIPVTADAGDSSDYYQAVLRQKDYIEEYGAAILSADSLVVESYPTYKLVHFDDFIFVTFKKEMEEVGYLSTEFSKRNVTFQRSLVMLLGNQLITVDKSGSFYNPQEFFTAAYWAWSEKMANSVPVDYWPGKK